MFMPTQLTISQYRTAQKKCTHLYNQTQGPNKHKRFQQSLSGVRRQKKITVQKITFITFKLMWPWKHVQLPQVVKMVLKSKTLTWQTFYHADFHRLHLDSFLISNTTAWCKISCYGKQQTVMSPSTVWSGNVGLKLALFSSNSYLTQAIDILHKLSLLSVLYFI